MEVLAGELLPSQKSLYLLTVDGDSNIHVFQYDPERKCKVGRSHDKTSLISHRP